MFVAIKGDESSVGVMETLAETPLSVFSLILALVKRVARFATLFFVMRLWSTGRLSKRVRPYELCHRVLEWLQEPISDLSESRGSDEAKCLDSRYLSQHQLSFDSPAFRRRHATPKSRELVRCLSGIPEMPADGC